MTGTDVLVVGGGSGGYATAIRASELGRSVVLVEKDRVGGTCLHRGCIPTKAMLHAGEVADTVRGASEIGIRSTLDAIDAGRIAAYRDGIVAKKFAGLKGLLAARGITVVTGTATLLGDMAVDVDGVRYEATDIVLATGAASRTIPGVTIGGRILTSEDALQLPEIPRSAIVLGGGVIGVEFASMWRSLGTDVTVVEAAERILPADDPVISSGIARAFRKRGITLQVGSGVTAVSQDADSVTVTIGSGAELHADVLLVAVGRTPVTDGIGLDAAGVAVTPTGFVEVDPELRTSAAGVWAVGDIVPGVQLAHRGFLHGIAVAERIAGLRPAPIADALIPRVTYSHPEAASVGVTEAQARATHGDDRVQTTEFNLAGNAKSEIIGTAGVIKVVRVVDGPVVGVHMWGDRVGELISEAQLVVGWEAHPEDVAPLIHAHPTQSEALGEAFLALSGKPLHAA